MPLRYLTPGVLGGLVLLCVGSHGNLFVGHVCAHVAMFPCWPLVLMRRGPAHPRHGPCGFRGGCRRPFIANQQPPQTNPAQTNNSHKPTPPRAPAAGHAHHSGHFPSPDPRWHPSALAALGCVWCCGVGDAAAGFIPGFECQKTLIPLAVADTTRMPESRGIKIRL